MFKFKKIASICKNVGYSIKFFKKPNPKKKLSVFCLLGSQHTTWKMGPKYNVTLNVTVSVENSKNLSSGTYQGGFGLLTTTKHPSSRSWSQVENLGRKLTLQRSSDVNEVQRFF